VGFLLLSFISKTLVKTEAFSHILILIKNLLRNLSPVTECNSHSNVEEVA